MRGDEEAGIARPEPLRDDAHAGEGPRPPVSPTQLAPRSSRLQPGLSYPRTGFCPRTGSPAGQPRVRPPRGGVSRKLLVGLGVGLGVAGLGGLIGVAGAIRGDRQHAAASRVQGGARQGTEADASSSGQAAGARAGRVVPFTIRSIQISPPNAGGGVGASLLATTAEGSTWDWAATATAIAEALGQSGQIDFAKVELQDAAVEPRAIGTRYKELATLYFARNPGKSPWADEPWALFPAVRRTSPGEADLLLEYDRQLAAALDKHPGDRDGAERLAREALARRFGLGAGWQSPPGNAEGGAKLAREAIAVVGSLPAAEAAKITSCLRSAEPGEFWECEGWPSARP